MLSLSIGSSSLRLLNQPNSAWDVQLNPDYAKPKMVDRLGLVQGLDGLGQGIVILRVSEIVSIFVAISMHAHDVEIASIV
jgi:hypothetical protein